MRKIIGLGFFLLSLVPAFGDIPTLQLDGSYGKSSPYKDEYQYTKMDYKEARKNPLKIGVKKKLGQDKPEVPELEARVKVSNDAEIQEKMKKAYLKESTKVYDLTDKEKETVKNNPWQFSDESLKKGKRVSRSQILAIGDKEYPFANCWFVGEGDLNGDGVREIVTLYREPVTHAGGFSELRVFDEKGAFVFAHSFSSMKLGKCAVLHNDQENKDEIVFSLATSSNYLFLYVLGCPKAGESLEALASDFPDTEILDQQPLSPNLVSPPESAPPGSK